MYICVVLFYSVKNLLNHVVFNPMSWGCQIHAHSKEHALTDKYEENKMYSKYVQSYL